MPIPLLPDFRFEEPAFLWLALPALLLLLLSGRRGPGPTIVFPALEMFGEDGRPSRNAPGAVSALLFVLAMLAGVAALARPQKVRELEITTGEGVEIDFMHFEARGHYLLAAALEGRLTALLGGEP